MPWRLEARDGQFCVVKQGETAPVPGGCHSSRAKALAHMRALYANTTAALSTIGDSMFPLEPPKAWFEEPEADQPTPPTITAEGRVFGHLAPWGTCHIGFLNGALSECVQAPKSASDYRLFHLGKLKTAEGEEIAVGKITYNSGHARLTADADEATSHYDHSGHVGAFVRARNGRHGIWLAGAVRSDISPEGLRDLKANPLSGDWRLLGNNLELVASLAVPVPGFPIPMAVAASGQVSALIMQGFPEEELDYEAEKAKLSADIGIRRTRAFIRDRALISAALTTEKRKGLARSSFAIPERRAYPIHDREHAANALARAAGKPEEARVRRAVCKRYPDMPSCKE